MTTPTLDPPPAKPQLGAAARSARRTLIEILAVLCLTVIPSLIQSAYNFLEPATQSAPVSPIILLIGEAIAVFREVAPLLFIMWITGKGFRHFGFNRIEPRDVLYTVGILIGSFMFHMLVWMVLSAAFPDLIRTLAADSESRVLHTFAQAQSGNAKLLLIPACLLVGFTEELIFRSYFLTRLTDLTGSKGQALFITVILFGFLHVYQGAMGIIGAAAMALFYGAVFIATRRFWPLAFAHALTDFISLASLGS